MRKRIYIAIIAALKQADVAKYISLWNEDIENLEHVAATEFPAVYVEFTPIQWAQRVGRVKTAQIRLNLHIITSSLASPENGSPTFEDALETFDVIDRVVAVIQGVNGDGFNQMLHAETQPDHSHGEIQHDIETFVCQAEDHSATRVKATIPNALPVIKTTPTED